MKRTIAAVASTALAICIGASSALAQVSCPPIQNITGGVRMDFPNGTRGEIIFPSSGQSGLLRLVTVDTVTGHTHTKEQAISNVSREITSGQINLGQVNGEWRVTSALSKDTVGWIATQPNPSWGFIMRREANDPSGFYFFYNGQTNSFDCVDDALAVPVFTEGDPNSNYSPYGIIQCGLASSSGIFRNCDAIEQQLQQCQGQLTTLETEIARLRTLLGNCETDREALRLENERLKTQIQTQTNDIQLVNRDGRRALRRMRHVVQVKGRLPRTNRDASRDFLAALRRLDTIFGGRVVTTPK